MHHTTWLLLALKFFHAALTATPVYELFGKTGITETNLPPLNQTLKHDLWLNCHVGKHDVLPADCDKFLNFADANVTQKKPRQPPTPPQTRIKIL